MHEQSSVNKRKTGRCWKNIQVSLRLFSQKSLLGFECSPKDVSAQTEVVLVC